MTRQLQPAGFPQWVAAYHAQVPAVTPLVLDVREPWEWSTASIRPLSQALAFDVLHVPMQELPQRVSELCSDRPIACLCHHGVRSQHVARWLQAQGFEDVVNLAGGIDAWSHELDPTVVQY